MHFNISTLELYKITKNLCSSAPFPDWLLDLYKVTLNIDEKFCSVSVIIGYMYTKVSEMSQKNFARSKVDSVGS